MNTTKEQIEKENIILKEDNRKLGEQDKLLRADFAKILNWYDIYEDKWTHKQDRALRNPSWAEIFAELGRLQSARTFYDLEGNVSELECKLEELENKIKKEIHPNL